jgi:quercetin dioxygenase-like cupin family protein
VPDLAASLVDLKDVDWETWDDPQLRSNSAVRWKLIFSAGRTPTAAMSIGLAEIEPGGVLPLHRHEPAEVYHILEGHGRVWIDGADHDLRPGRMVFIPPDALHRTLNTGDGALRFMFMFPVCSFDDVVYRFAPISPQVDE